MPSIVPTAPGAVGAGILYSIHCTNMEPVQALIPAGLGGGVSAGKEPPVGCSPRLRPPCHGGTLLGMPRRHSWRWEEACSLFFRCSDSSPPPALLLDARRGRAGLWPSRRRGQGPGCSAHTLGRGLAGRRGRHPHRLPLPTSGLRMPGTHLQGRWAAGGIRSHVGAMRVGPGNYSMAPILPPPPRPHTHQHTHTQMGLASGGLPRGQSWGGGGGSGRRSRSLGCVTS